MDNSDILKEACVGNFQQALLSEQLGANRIELCENLAESGTTPSYGTIYQCKKRLKIPTSVIIRPRGGNFIYNDDEFEIMKKDIEMCKQINVDGVVIGCLYKDRPEINLEQAEEMVKIANPLKVTFHMAFDEVNDQFKALDQLISIGVVRVLTKGCKTNATDGKENLKKLIEYAGNKITIMPGGGIHKDNYQEIVNYTKAKEVHGTKIVGSLIQK